MILIYKNDNNVCIKIDQELISLSNKKSVAFSDGTLLDCEDSLKVVTVGRSFITHHSDGTVYLGKDIKWYLIGDQKYTKI